MNDGERQPHEPAEHPTTAAMPDKTLLALVSKARAGDQQAVDRVFELVYSDLRAAAQRIVGRGAQHSLSATEMVNEAYMRMRASDFPDVSSRRHLVNTAAIVLRRVLLDHIRKKSRAKRGGPRGRGELQVDPAMVPAIRNFGIERFELVHKLLDDLAIESPESAEIVTMRVMLGLPVEQIAELLEMSETTVKVRWRVGLGWLRERLELPGASGEE